MDSYNVSTDVDEANVADLSDGMTVKIKTDSTGDDVLSGKIIFISPTPTKNSSGTSAASSAGTADTGKTDKSRGTYKTLISIDTPNSRLRLGMTARLTVVLSSADNVTAVPVSAISTDASGNSAVLRTTDGGLTSEEVVITAGLENDYYAEVASGDIKNGDVIIIPSDDTEDSTGDGLGALGGIM